MNRCKTCLWWERIYDSFHARKKKDKPTDYGICHCEAFGYGAFEKKYPKSYVYIQDCDGTFEEIQTGEEFGCVHWEEEY